MALFTDGFISTAKDLQQYEASVLSDANAEGIDVAAKVILAQQDVGGELLLFLVRRAAFRDDQPNIRRSVGLADVVVTDALRHWHIHKTLAMVYQDAYNNQLNERYQGKWKQYEQLAKGSSRTYFQLGAGVVADPIPKAAIPAVSTVPGSGNGATFYVAVTWVNAAGEEGVPSAFAEVTTLAGEALSVAAPTGFPPNATGWNTYVGVSPSAMMRQNATPLVQGTAWVMTGALIAGAPLGMGQKPTWFIVDRHFIERG
jgi:hypothetical protein